MKTYKTGKDTWDHGQNTHDGHKFLGPCPICGARCFDYGGAWRCLGGYCQNSPGNPTPSLGEAPKWWNTDIQVYKDGDAWCAVFESSFINLQESIYGFGWCPMVAVDELVKAKDVRI